GIFQDIHLQVRRFLFITVVSAVFVGVLSWGAFVLLGFEQAAFWGTVAGIASAIPYLGPFLVLLGTGAAAFIQFGSIEMAVLIAGVSLLITSIQGYLLLPMMTSRVASINMVATFAGLLFWGWIWGPVGLIIATPLIMIMKSLCDHSEPLQPLGELLGE
ncbi:MAG: AI-2E family transporter, partial [Spongiibacteraceae bacterium]|nr:AI-2E family transporter [Spongiibacteraceae bacterium]